MATQWKSPNWTRELIRFRGESANLIREGHAESFHSDMMQSLYSDQVHNITKIHILALLQDNAKYILESYSGVEQTIFTLLDIFKQPFMDSNINVRVQCLITMVSLCLEFSIMEKDPTLGQQVTDLMLEIISQTNAPGYRVLRCTSCLCLRELEAYYPNMFSAKLSFFYQFYQDESSTINQCYALLFMQTLHGTLTSFNSSSHRLSPNVLNEFLLHKKGSLTPFDGVIHYEAVQQVDCGALDDDIDVSELESVVSYITENISLHSIAVMPFLLDKIHYVHMKLPKLSNKFHAVLLSRFSQTHDIGLLQYACSKMGRSIEGEEVLPSIKESLLQSLLVCVNHPAVTRAHKLLLLQWLIEQHWVTLASLKGVILNFPDQYIKIFPHVFDKPDVQLKKQNLVSKALIPMRDNKVKGIVLLQSIKIFHQFVMQGSDGVMSSSLFIAIKRFIQEHAASEAVQHIVSRLILDTMKAHIFLMPKFIELIQGFSVEELRCFKIELLSAMLVEVIPACPGLLDYQYILPLLREASSEKGINPKEIISHLKKYMTSVGNQDDLLDCNAVLTICRTLMQRSNVELICKDLGDVLNELSQMCSDEEVKDRSRFFYEMLNCLSPLELSDLLAHTKFTNTEAMRGIERELVIVCLENSPFNIIRDVSTAGIVRFDKEKLDIHSSECLLDEYFSLLQAESTNKEVLLNYDLQLVSGESRFQNIYALELTYTISQWFQSVPGTSMFSLEAGSTEKVQLCLHPKKPIPTSIAVQAMFTSQEGLTYFTHLDPLLVSINMLFLPLPCAELWSYSDLLLLFHQLWEKYTNDTHRGLDSGQESVLALSLSVEETAQNLKLLKDFILNEKELDNAGAYYEMAIFLPPSHHLLCKVTSRKQTTTISMATDSAFLLPLVSAFFSQTFT